MKDCNYSLVFSLIKKRFPTGNKEKDMYEKTTIEILSAGQSVLVTILDGEQMLSVQTGKSGEPVSCRVWLRYQDVPLATMKGIVAVADSGILPMEIPFLRNALVRASMTPEQISDSRHLPGEGREFH